MPQNAAEDLWGASQQPWEHANQGFPKLSKAYFGKNSDMAGTMGCNHEGAAACKTACWNHQGGGGVQQVPPGLHGWILPCSIASYVWDGVEKRCEKWVWVTLSCLHDKILLHLCGASSGCSPVSFPTLRRSFGMLFMAWVNRWGWVFPSLFNPSLYLKWFQRS